MVGGSSMSGSAWKLDPVKSSIVLPGRLPYPEVHVYFCYLVLIYFNIDITSSL